MWESFQWLGVRWWFLPDTMVSSTSYNWQVRLSRNMAEKVTKDQNFKFKLYVRQNPPLSSQPASIIPQVKIVNRDWLTEVNHSSVLCSRGSVTPPEVHILRLLMKSSLPLVVTPSREISSLQSSATLTSSKTAGGLSPHQPPVVV